MPNKCIYCGRSDDLSESDIIPDALTNSRIFNKNVCRVEHNNRFSDMFESKAIDALAFIANELDIKSSKSKDYQRYPATFNIGEVQYVAKLSSDTELFHGKKIKSTDGKILLGLLDDMETIAKDKTKVSPVDLNMLEIEKNVKLKISIYFDQAMFRMIAKIAYEWYCSRNKIDDYYSNFEKIVTYITTREGENLVFIVQEKAVYDLIADHCNLGSHCLLAYQDSDFSLNIVVSLFGIAIYKVTLSNDIPTGNFMNFLYQELCTDGSRKELYHNSLQSLGDSVINYLNDSSQFIPAKVHDMNVSIATNQNGEKFLENFFVMQLSGLFMKDITTTQTPNEKIINLVIENINTILQAGLLHKKSLKRFVKEHFNSFPTTIMLNPNGSNKKNIFFFYVLFLLGSSGAEVIDNGILQGIVKSNLSTKSSNEISLNEAIVKEMLSTILCTLDYSEIINKGASLVDAW